MEENRGVYLILVHPLILGQFILSILILDGLLEKKIYLELMMVGIVGLRLLYSMMIDYTWESSFSLMSKTDG